MQVTDSVLVRVPARGGNEAHTILLLHLETLLLNTYLGQGYISSGARSAEISRELGI